MDTGTVVGHHDFGVVAGCVGDNSHVSFAGKLGSVVENVEEGLLDQRGVSAERRKITEFLQKHRMRMHAPRPPDRSPDRVRKIDPILPSLQGAGFQLCHVEEVRNEA